MVKHNRPQLDDYGQHHAACEGDIVAPINGSLIACMVAVGQAVADGDALMVVEAMKMENELKATSAGTVSKICVAEGEQVQARTTLIELE